MKVEIDISAVHETLIVSIKNNEMTDEVTEIIEKLETDSTSKIIGKSNDSIYLLDPREIVCFYSEGNKVKLDTLERQYEAKEKLYIIEEKLKRHGFVRLSKYAIANVNMIKRIEVEFNGSLLVHFKNDKCEGISRRNVSKVKNYLGIGGKKWVILKKA